MDQHDLAKRRKSFVPSEDFESTSFAGWLELQIAQGAPVKFTHIPNETPTSPIQAKRLQRMGVRRGVPDYMLIICNKLVFIELKRAEGGKISVHQQQWLDALTAAGVGAHVCEGASEAKVLVQNLLDA